MNERDIPKACRVCGCNEMDVYVQIVTWASYKDGRFIKLAPERGMGELKILFAECPRCPS